MIWEGGGGREQRQRSRKEKEIKALRLDEPRAEGEKERAEGSRCGGDA